MFYISIDPGASGSIALLDEDKIVRIEDVPITPSIYGSGKELNAILLSDMISELLTITNGIDNCCVAIEQVSAMPNQGVSSTFKFGVSFGILKGLFAGLKIPTHYIKPTEWKTHFGLVNKEKDASRTLVLQMYPSLSKDLKYKKSNGKSDAILIGLYLRARNNGEISVKRIRAIGKKT
jgi:crossover junction endodeoxyribonuclease RuvC